MVPCGAVWCGVVWCGGVLCVVCFGFVWFLVWYCAVWDGIKSSLCVTSSEHSYLFYSSRIHHCHCILSLSRFIYFFLFLPSLSLSLCMSLSLSLSLALYFSLLLSQSFSTSQIGKGGSSVIQTSWAVMGLIALGSRDREAIDRGIRFIMHMQVRDMYSVSIC